MATAEPARSAMENASLGARAYPILSALLLLLVIIQIFVAASGLFTMGRSAA